MARLRTTRPLVAGPDLEGRTLVVAGDRTCWFGEGEPPQAPGAIRLDAAAATIAAGRAAWGVPREVDDTVTTLIMAGPPGLLGSLGGVARSAGLRVILAAEVVTREDEEGAKSLFLGNRDPLVRVAVLGAGAGRLRDALGLAVVDRGDDPHSLTARCFGRAAGLSAGSLGDAVVVDERGQVRHACVGGRLRIHGGSDIQGAHVCGTMGRS